MRKYQFDLQSAALTPESIQAFDCVLVSTNHDAFDYELIAKHAKAVVAARLNLMCSVSVLNLSN